MSVGDAEAQVAAWLAGAPVPAAEVIGADPLLMRALLQAVDTVDELAPDDPDGALDLLEGLAEDALTAMPATARRALAPDGLGPRAAMLIGPFVAEAAHDPRVVGVLRGALELAPADDAWATEALETLSGLIDELAVDSAAALAAEARWLDPLTQALEQRPMIEPAGAFSAALVRIGPGVHIGDGDAPEPPLDAPIPVEGPPGLPPLEWSTDAAPATRRWAPWVAVIGLAAAAALFVWRSLGPTPTPPSIPIGVGPLVPAPPEPARPDPADTLAATPHRPKMLPIAAGAAWLGSPDDEPGRQPDETRRRVTLTRPFWMARTEVTQAQWAALMGNRPGQFSGLLGGGPLHPVEMVSWHDAVAYANALSTAEGLPECYVMSDCAGTPGDRSFTCRSVTFEGLDCRGYRLPTEAEWEYAARAGTTTATYAGPFELLGERHAPVLDDIAWYSGNSGVPVGGMGCAEWTGRPPGVDDKGCATQPAATKAANPWGLHDMLGNVWEWTTDGHGELSPDPAIDPQVPPGARMVTKGCGWFREARFCRAANRYRPKADYRTWVLGIRVVRTRPE